MVPRAALDGDVTTGLADAIERAGAMVRFERGERPIRFQHMDSAFGTDQDREIRWAWRGIVGGFGGGQNRFGVFKKSSHTELIGPFSRVFRKNLTY